MAIRSIKVKFWLLILLGCTGTVYPQSMNWELIKTLEIPNADLLDVDSRGNIFISDQKGTVRQFDQQGDSLNIYSPAFTSQLSQLECHWTVNIFLYASDLQQVVILDRFLHPLSVAKIGDLGILGLVANATLGNNNMIWMFDDTDLTLKKLNFRTKQLVQEQPLNTVLPNSSLGIISMRERKNLLFLQVKDEGVYIFDNQGNPIKKINLPVNLEVAIEGENFFYLQDQVLIKKNYITDQEDKIPIPDKGYKGVALSLRRVVLKGTDFVDIYNRPAGL